MASIPTGSKPWPLPGWPIAALKALPPTAPASPAHVGCGYWARFTRPDSQTAKRRLAFQSQAAFFLSAMDQIENEDPHPHVVVAFGFLITKREPSRPS